MRQGLTHYEFVNVLMCEFVNQKKTNTFKHSHVYTFECARITGHRSQVTKKSLITLH